MPDFTHIISLLENEDLASLKRFNEGLTLDYKRELPKFDTEEGKGSFAIDVVSFANSSGGLLIYGVAEDKGAPGKLMPFKVVNIDALKRQFSQILDSWVEPKLCGISLKEILTKNGEYFFVVQIGKSWRTLHAIKNPGKNYLLFYGRNSAGHNEAYKHAEIKNGFLFKETIVDRIKLFREQKIRTIEANDCCLSLANNPKIVLHLLPVMSFEGNPTFDVGQYCGKIVKVGLIANGYSLTWRRNIDGLLIHDSTSEGSHFGYTQLYRNGIIECVDARILEPSSRTGAGKNEKNIPATLVEQSLIEMLKRLVEVIKTLGITPPIFFALSLIGVKNYTIMLDPMIQRFSQSALIGKDILFLPEEELDIDFSASDILKSSFDLIWNACGHEKSINYDENGERIIK